MTEERFFSTAELAGLAGMPGTDRGVRMQAEREGWASQPRNARGGGRAYAMSALPVQTQAALIQRDAPAAPSITIDQRNTRPAPTAATIDTLATVYEGKPQKQKDEAQRRLRAVQAYLQLRGLGHASSIAESAVATQHAISPSTLHRWLQMIDGYPNDKWLYALTPGYCGRIATAELSEDAWMVLKADYLRPEQPTAKACIRRLQRIAPAQGWTLPAERTLERRLANLPRSTKVLARKGLDAAAELYPAQHRDKTALQALDIVVADGYTHNVFVTMPDGEKCRVKGWYWQDVYSGKVLAYRIDRTEHTDIIRLSFGDLVQQWGIPRAVNLDNTLAAANKTMSGGVPTRFRFKVKEDDPLGVFPLLDVKVMWATPGHGQAKPIERAFGKGGLGEVIDRHPSLAGAYTGSGPQNKPSNYGERAVPLQLLLDVIETEVVAFNARQGRRSVIAQGRSFDAIFGESYAAATIRKATEQQSRLWLLATEPVTAHSKDGSITLDAGRTIGDRQRGANRYWHAAMTEYAGHKLVARFDPQRLHQGTHIYTLDGRYVCFADCHAPQGYADGNAAREHNRARKQFIRAERDQLAAESRMSALEAAKLMTAAESDMSPVVNPLNPKVVSVQFRDPLRRETPKAHVSADVLALRAELEAEAATPRAEIEQSNVIEGTDFVARYRLANRIAQRIAAGDQVHARDAAWAAEYLQSPEYADTKEMFEGSAQPVSA